MKPDEISSDFFSRPNDDKRVMDNVRNEVIVLNFRSDLPIASPSDSRNGELRYDPQTGAHQHGEERGKSWGGSLSTTTRECSSNNLQFLPALRSPSNAVSS